MTFILCTRLLYITYVISAKFQPDTLANLETRIPQSWKRNTTKGSTQPAQKSAKEFPKMLIPAALHRSLLVMEQRLSSPIYGGELVEKPMFLQKDLRNLSNVFAAIDVLSSFL